MFQSEQSKKTCSEQRAALPHEQAAQRIWRVQSLHSVLKPAKVQACLTRIRKACPVEDALYQDYFRPLIDRFAEHVQMLPLGAHAAPGSLLMEALQRTESALACWAEQPQPARNQELYLFAVFSAAILLDSDKLFQSYQVNCLSEEGDVLRVWNPYRGPLSDYGPYYALTPIYHHTALARSSIISTLARQWIEEDMFAALSDCKPLYYTWIALLKGDSASLGVLGVVHDLFFNEEAQEAFEHDVAVEKKAASDKERAEKKAREHKDKTRDKAIEQEKKSELESDVDALMEEGGDPSDLSVEHLRRFNPAKAAEFMRWAENQMKDQQAANDKDNLMHAISEDGVLIEPFKLMEFLRAAPSSPGLLYLYKQMMAWMGVAVDPALEPMARFRSHYPGEGPEGKLREGLLIPFEFFSRKPESVTHFTLVSGGAPAEQLFQKSEAQHGASR